MRSSNDISTQLKDTVTTAASEVGSAANRNFFQIIGGKSKRFLGREPIGIPFPVADHQGIVNYEPKELVITARCGTKLTEIESVLAERGQMLPFEPPHFGPSTTLGGTIAAGLSGPRRPYTGSVRDFVLGIRLLNGRGEILRFGGEVMKNVAGYDVSRLMVGAMGTLGVILDMSLKVIPIPAKEITLVREHTIKEAIRLMNTWAARPLPLSGTCFDGKRLYVRLSGVSSAVRLAKEQLGGELFEVVDKTPSHHSDDKDDNQGNRFWTDVREQRHPFFPRMSSSRLSKPLWRLSVPPATLPMPLTGTWFIEWGGGQRWLQTDEPIYEIRKLASAVGGHAILFRGGDRGGEIFHPLAPKLADLHRRVKQAFDPHCLFNPGRLYSTL
uniref:Glycolate oxidase FAD binding subunit n=1 Tax=Candidatus Kentrum sp. TUN TaxID=2126343 RepID=A0A450ZGM9_9GAMM|nr:MAG: glycolate oxidase FAD binding subunit [Candidatus Kentron sp. TUN]VFK52972.1 MAG: glycolate oxidase FAD binding subunit [Candidatus Kentron sp. TUN]VFK53516.1 MAG: glycolate oxidase FAD binding subunit [Candidatus Kentron sp. TUN]